MGLKKKDISTINNFDLIRLLSALQVVFTHSLHHYEINGYLKKLGQFFIFYFPGVPIFFTISGFLIYWSFDRNSNDLKKYFKNRFLRLFPALWVCFILCTILILFDCNDSILLVGNSDFWVWCFGQITIFQFWTPDILRFWGVGTPNGSLWTIIVEIQFYLLVPVLFFFSNKFKNGFLFLIIIFSVFLNVYFGTFNEESVEYKVAGVAILPYLYNFIFGILAYKYWGLIKKMFEGKFLFWFAIYLIYIIIFGCYLQNDLNSYFLYTPFQFISNVILAGVILSAAFTNLTLSVKILKHNDLSYGIYIYHMLVINFFCHRGLVGKTKYVLLTFILTIILAALSWKLVEQRILKKKR